MIKIDDRKKEVEEQKKQEIRRLTNLHLAAVYGLVAVTKIIQLTSLPHWTILFPVLLYTCFSVRNIIRIDELKRK